MKVLKRCVIDVTLEKCHDCPWIHSGEWILCRRVKENGEINTEPLGNSHTCMEIKCGEEDTFPKWCPLPGKE